MARLTLLVSEGLLHIDIFPPLTEADRIRLERESVRIRPQVVVERHLRDLLQERPYRLQTTFQPLGPELDKVCSPSPPGRGQG